MPVDAVENPFAAPVVDGADQPVGTTNRTSPDDNPPVAAVYVNTTVRPVRDADHELTSPVIVPDPSAANTVPVGSEAIAVKAPAEVDFSVVVNVTAPVVEPFYRFFPVSERFDYYAVEWAALLAAGGILAAALAIYVAGLLLYTLFTGGAKEERATGDPQI